MANSEKLIVRKISLEEIKNNLYTYKAHVLDVYDGDTITVAIDLGMDIYKKTKIRFYGINAPELDGSRLSDKEKAEARRSKNYVYRKISSKEIYIQTVKDKTEKYGRYLGIIWVLNEKNKYYECLNDMMLRNNLAKSLLY